MRFYYMVVIIVGILLMLNLAGITTPSGSMIKKVGLVNNQGNLTYGNFKNSSVLGDFNNPGKSKTNTFAYILGGLIVAGLIASAFGKAPDIRYITAGFVLAITGMLIGDLVWLFVYVQGKGVLWITSLLSLIIGSLLVGLIITALQFWQGSD